MAFVRVARAEEIPPGTTAFFCVNSKPILVASVDGQFYAMYGLCPHRNYPLKGTTLFGTLIDCPWHHFEYDVRTDENYFPRNVHPSDMSQLEAQLRPMQTYPVEVRDGEIWVNLE